MFIYCDKCGAKNNDTAVFCRECGNSLALKDDDEIKEEKAGENKVEENISSDKKESEVKDENKKHSDDNQSEAPEESSLNESTSEEEDEDEDALNPPTEILSYGNSNPTSEDNNEEEDEDEDDLDPPTEILSYGNSDSTSEDENDEEDEDEDSEDDDTPSDENDEEDEDEDENTSSEASFPKLADLNNPLTDTYWDDVIPEIEEEIYQIPKDIIIKAIIGTAILIIFIVMLIIMI